MKTKDLKNPIMRLFVEEAIHAKDKRMAREIQTALNNLGLSVVVDGDIGGATIGAIKRVNNKKLAQAIIDKHDAIHKVYDGDIPAWLHDAYKELGVKEIRGKRGSNPRVEQYHTTAGIGWADDDVPWCGSFIAFIMHKNGYKIPKQPARALSWLNFGESAHKPVVGSIAVKKRKGGGHVTFVVGTSPDGNYLYGLGGNQGDAVTIHRYPVRVFKDFRVPSGYKGKVRTVSGINASKGLIREA